MQLESQQLHKKWLNVAGMLIPDQFYRLKGVFLSTESLFASLRFKCKIFWEVNLKLKY
jgi:hypothetical protein